jgi:hypothetical protein
MANPNIANLTTITGYNTSGYVGTTATTLITNAPSTGFIMKINSVILCNRVATTETLSLDFDSGGGIPMYAGLAIPSGTTFLAIDKDMCIYLREGQSLTASTSTASGLSYVTNYEIIEDT